LLERYRTWRGGRGFDDVTLIAAVAKIRIADLDATRGTWVDATGRYAETLDAGPIRTKFVATKADAWSQGPDGRVERSATGDRRYWIASILSPWILRANWRSNGTERRYGRAWSVVTARFPGQLTISLFIASESGELGGVRVAEPEGSHFSRFEDWRLIDGVRSPFVEKTEAVNLEQDGSEALEAFSYTAVTFNRPMPADIFAPPRLRTTVSFQTPAQRTGPIAFSPRTDLIFVVEIAGRQVLALLDSGASVTHLDAAFARDIGVHGAGAFETPGTSGDTITVQAAEGPPILVSGMTIAGQIVGLSDLSVVRRSVGRPIEIILGQDVLDNVVAAIDFEAGSLEFIAPSRFQAPAEARSLPIRRIGTVPTVQVRLEDIGLVDFAIDLGNAAAPLILYGSFWKPRRMLAHRRWSTTSSIDVSGPRASRQAKITAAALGEWRFRDLPALFVDLDKGKGMENLAGNIGLPLLSRFGLVLDYPSGQIQLTPNSAIDRPFASVDVAAPAL
jgi:hypothetical protein